MGTRIQRKWLADREFRTMEDMETMIDTMIKLYRYELNDIAMRCGFTALETVTCSQELDKWILLAIGKRHHKQPNKIKRQTGRA